MATTDRAPLAPPTGTFCLPNATALIVDPSEDLVRRATAMALPVAFARLVTIKLLAPEESRELVISGLRGVEEILRVVEEHLVERELRLRGR